MDRHCQQALTSTLTGDDDAFTRLLDHQNAFERPYRRRKDELKTVLHWGQRKLLISEIEFLTDYHLTRSSSDLTASPTTLIYAGAAPGSHILFLAELFPEVHFVLVDPRPFTIKDELQRRVRADRAAHKSESNSRVNDYRWEKIEIRQSYFTDEMAVTLKRELGEKGHHVLFVSDVRTSEDAEDQRTIERDMELQKSWHLALKPFASHFKFRLPWTEGKTEYLRGQITLPVWSPITSTECRLVVGEGNEREVYDHAKYERQMFYFQTEQRVRRYESEFSEYSRCRCYDCTAEGFILEKYVRKKVRGGAPGSLKRSSKEVLDLVKELSGRLDKECHRDKREGNERTIFDSAPDPGVRKRNIQKRQKLN